MFTIKADQMSDMLYETEGHGSGLFMPELEDPEHCNANNTAVFELYVLKVGPHLLLLHINLGLQSNDTVYSQSRV